MKQAIRLTNKTAVALRKSAQRVRTAHFAAAVILSIVMLALGVYLGLKWLPAVPLMVAACVLLDCALMLHGKSEYLLLLGQAICTEAAAREIRAGSSESMRRERAISDLINVKADAQLAASGTEKKAQGKKPFFEKAQEEDEDDDPDMLPEQPKMTAEKKPAGRRRRQQTGLQIIRSEQAK